ncbi:MAG: hypothetical protein GKS00_02550 [Alphaproteobacteria bacterium]|nr:hypothetical protein [Alphaproteobacteria bacterium]
MGSQDESTVNFSQKFFTAVEGSYFRKSHETEEPVFVLNLGGEEVMLPFPGIRREFDIEEDSSDDVMLGLVASGLDYVKVLMPGDDLPKELLTGEASWDVSDEHRKIAQQRLSMQLVSWVSGDENLITDPQQLLQIADDPAVKEKVNSAFDEAAKAIGLEAGEGNKIVDLIEELAEELAYIETLREQFRGVVSMEQKIKRLRNVAAKHRSILDSATSVAKLISIAVKEFGEEFDMADGQTGEIIAVLKNITAQKEFIRGTRNSVYRRLVAWDGLLRGWEQESGQYTATIPDLLRETYRFLAPRYMQTDDWLLAAQSQGQSEPQTEQVW